jgi:hypothetical protein
MPSQRTRTPEAIRNLEERAYAHSRGFGRSLATTCDVIESLHDIGAHQLAKKPNGDSFDSFAEYVSYKFPPGLGFSQDAGGIGIEALIEQIMAFDPNRPSIGYLGGKRSSGKPGVGKGNTNACKVKNKSHRSVDCFGRNNLTAAAMADRLEREFPKIWADYKAGKIKSVTAAAIQAGIRSNPRADAVAECRRAWNRMSTAERKAFAKLIASIGTGDIDTKAKKGGSK